VGGRKIAPLASTVFRLPLKTPPLLSTSPPLPFPPPFLPLHLPSQVQAFALKMYNLGGESMALKRSSAAVAFKEDLAAATAVAFGARCAAGRGGWGGGERRRERG
jgi:hypothetical protein